MKTTNFFIDFIIVGLIGASALFFLVYMIRDDILLLVLQNTNSVLQLTPILTVVTYIIGVVFNQFSDQLVKGLLFLPKLKKIKEEKDQLEKEFGLTDHDYVQEIVYRSPSAYEYLSYRRSIIRIIRSLMVFAILVLVLHPVSSLGALYFSAMKWSPRNAFLLSLLVILLLLLGLTLRKVEVGYFKAIRSFYSIIQDDKAGTPTPGKGNGDYNTVRIL